MKYITQSYALNIYKAHIKKIGGRWTKERECILKELCDNKKLLPSNNNKSYSRATYYNILNELIELKLCVKLNAVYELAKTDPVEEIINLYNELIETAEHFSTNNKVVIEDVKSWSNHWRNKLKEL
jgi:Fe2+ or Zn2+ uptake regulation protein